MYTHTINDVHPNLECPKCNKYKCKQNNKKTTYIKLKYIN